MAASQPCSCERFLCSYITASKHSPCLGDGGALAFAFVVKWMSMLEAEVSMAVFTYHFHELFLPTARLPTFISEYLNTET